jgi:general secretion pathway protein B
MSLILDALKRAERERRAGQAPQPLDSVAVPVPDAAERSAHRWLLPALIGAVVAGVAVYAFLLLRAPSTPATVVVAAPRTATPPPAAPQPTAEPEAAPPAAAEMRQRDAANPPPPNAPTDDGRVTTLDDLVDSKRTPPRDMPRPPPKDQLAAADQDTPPDSAAEATVVKPASAPAAEQLPPFEQPVGPPPPEATAPTPTPTADRPVPPAASLSDPAPPQPALSTATASVSAEALAASARNFKEMSPNYRAEFPALTVDIHVFNDDPARRFVMLNGKHYREGDTIAEGPRIVGIVPDGIVFDWRGERVLYSLTR